MRTDTLLQDIRDAPLDWIASELKRLRLWPASLHLIADAPDYRSDVMAQVISDLRVALPRLFACEGAALLPILRLAAHRDDDIETASATLMANHRYLSAHIRQVLPRLEAFRVAEAPLVSDSSLVEKLHDLATRGRSHLALTSAIILPIARLRLKAADLDLLATELVNQLGLA